MGRKAKVATDKAIGDSSGRDAVRSKSSAGGGIFTDGVRAADPGELRCNARGRALITTRAFKQGEIVLQEAPAIVTNRKLATIGGAESANAFDVGLAREAYEVLTSQQKQLLADFSAGETPFPPDLSSMCEAQPELQPLINFARVVRINAHVHPQEEKTALFVLVARANHSCNPSCGLASAPGGQLLFYALRDLEMGDEVDYSYLGGHFLLHPTSTRREQLLRTKLFECLCSRCVATETTQQDGEHEAVGDIAQDRLKVALLSKLQAKVETLEAAWGDPAKNVAQYIRDWENVAQQCGKLLGAEHHLHARACFFSLQALTTGRCCNVGNVTDDRFFKGMTLFALPLVAYLQACCPIGARRAALEPVGRAVIELGRTHPSASDQKAALLSQIITAVGTADLRTCLYDDSLNETLRRVVDAYTISEGKGKTQTDGHASEGKLEDRKIE